MRVNNIVQMGVADDLQIKNTASPVLQWTRGERKIREMTTLVVFPELLTKTLNVSYLQRLVHIICACQRIYEYDC